MQLELEKMKFKTEQTTRPPFFILFEQVEDAYNWPDTERTLMRQ